jgi:hypothetical protein
MAIGFRNQQTYLGLTLSLFNRFPNCSFPLRQIAPVVACLQNRLVPLMIAMVIFLVAIIFLRQVGIL